MVGQEANRYGSYIRFYESIVFEDQSRQSLTVKDIKNALSYVTPFELCWDLRRPKLFTWSK
jgi:hypothetical protein